LITLGEIKNPPTHIHSPLAKAVKARLITKTGKTEETKTTRDSAAIRSRKSHMIQVKNAEAVGWKLESQYAITEKINAIMTRSNVTLISVIYEEKALT